jgi:hypothetical protein
VYLLNKSPIKLAPYRLKNTLLFTN